MDDERIFVFSVSGDGSTNASVNADLKVARGLLADIPNISVHYHPATDCLSEFPHNHYHGIYRPTTQRWDNQENIRRLISLCKKNGYWKSERCKAPAGFLKYLQVPPRTPFLTQGEYKERLADVQPYVAEYAKHLDKKRLERLEKESGACNRSSKVASKSSNALLKIIAMLFLSMTTCVSDFIGYFTANPDLAEQHGFMDVYSAHNFGTLLQKAMGLVVQAYLSMPLMELSLKYVKQKSLGNNKDVLFSLYRSACLLANWTRLQGMDFDTFVDQCISVFDKTRAKRNSIILQGATNAAKTWVFRSLIRCAHYYGECYSGQGGYQFMWNDCVDKRAIIMDELFLDMSAIEQFKLIQEGRDTRVNIKNKNQELLRRTPLFITCNRDIWRYCSNAKPEILARSHYYNNLKPFDEIAKTKEDLHPGIWAFLAYLSYYTPNNYEGNLKYLIEMYEMGDPITDLNEFKMWCKDQMDMKASMDIIFEPEMGPQQGYQVTELFADYHDFYNNQMCVERSHNHLLKDCDESTELLQVILGVIAFHFDLLVTCEGPALDFLLRLWWISWTQKEDYTIREAWDYFSEAYFGYGVEARESEWATVSTYFPYTLPKLSEWKAVSDQSGSTEETEEKDSNQDYLPEPTWTPPQTPRPRQINVKEQIREHKRDPPEQEPPCKMRAMEPPKEAMK